VCSPEDNFSLLNTGFTTLIIPISEGGLIVHVGN